MTYGLMDRGIIGQPAEHDPYLTFPAAVQAGILPHPEAMARPADGSVGVDIANGHIPNNKGAGIIDLRSDLIAFDHASVEFSGNELRVYPATKEAVSSQGVVMLEGAILMQKPSWVIKLAALAIDTDKNPWLAHRLNRRARRLGGIATFPLGPEAPEYEIKDVDSVSGLVLAKKINRFF